MKKFLFFFIGFILIASAAFAVTGYPTKQRIKTVTLTSVGTRYELPIPPGTGSIQMQSRTAVDYQIYQNTTDTAIYYTGKSGSVLNIAPIAADTTLYLQSGSAGQIIELMYWQ